MKLVHVDHIETERVSHDPGIIRRVLLGEDELPGSVRLSHALLVPGQQVTPHRHEDLFEIFYLLSGEGVLTVEDADYPIGAGSCFAIEPGEEHALVNIGSSDMALLYFGLFAKEQSTV